VRRTNGGSRYAVPLSIEPDRGQLSEYGTHSSSKDRCDVFQDDCPGLEQSSQANDFKEQATPVACEPCPFSGNGNVLTGEATCDDVNPPRLDLVAWWERLDVVPASDVRPVLGEDSRCIVVNLHLPRAGHPSPFKSQV